MGVVGALGVVFGDIGTSPLYAFKTAGMAIMDGGLPIDQVSVLGLLSMIVWTLILVVSLWYIGFILRADNEGEGGMLALITRLRLQKDLSGHKRVLLLIGLAGTAMVFGDGVLTPAISVLSAVEGLQVVNPELGHHVVPITGVILFVLFVGQRFGTEKIGVLFGPICFVWFAVLAALGFYHIMENPLVLRALSPYYAYTFLVGHPALTAAILGGVFLAVTGCEALYADLGHFGRKTIAKGWFIVVMPGLVLNYLGQGALVLSNPQAIENPMFLMAPESLQFPLLILAAVATIIASQALITGVFSLTKQAIEIGYMPPMRMKHTSHTNRQQIYLNRVNNILMIACILVVVSFGSSERLASAYGVSVSLAMLATTILFTMLSTELFKISRPASFCLATLPITFDLAFVGANMTKLFHGGWLPLMMAGVVLFIMLSWRRGVDAVVERHLGYTELMEDFRARIDRAPLTPIAKTAIFFSRSGIMAPVPLERMTELMRIKFQRIVVVSLRIASKPRVPADERITVEKIGDDFFKIIVRIGYLQDINMPAILAPALRSVGIEQDEAIYIIGSERIVAPERIEAFNDIMERAFAAMAVTAERSVDRFKLPKRRTLEMGYTVYLEPG